MINESNIKEEIIKLNNYYGENKINLTLNGIKCNNELYEYLKSNYNTPITQTFYNILHNIKTPPVCINCGKPVKFLSIKRGYRKFCSNKCVSSSQYIKDKKEKTCLNHYGVKNPYQSEQIKRKIKNDNLIKYGVEHPQSLNIIKEKVKRTCMEKYGVIAPMQLSIVRSKSIDTCMEKYGVKHISQSKEIKERIKQTNLKKYGTEYYTQTDDFKECLRKNKDTILEKRRQTCLKKYGVDNPLKDDKIQNKRINTLKTNNTFNKSKEEEYLFNLLKNIYPNSISQYKDIRYSYRDKNNKIHYFICDMYVPELDLFIEYNGFCTHNNHKFDVNLKEDINTLNEWKEKYKNGHLMYKSMINTWTKRDPLKRKIAKENKLNFKEIWSIEEFKKYLNNFK